MTTETVPADIAAAISEVVYCSQRFGTLMNDDTVDDQNCAVAALYNVILAHLRKADELKAALERIEQGV
jgi:hypothetical protein